MTLMTLYDLFFTIMPTFSPAPTLVETDVSSSSIGTVSLTLLPLISISILIPVILFFTYRLFKRAPTLPIRLPLPSAWSQWLQGRATAAVKGQSKSRLPPAKLPKFIQKLSGSSSPVELLPTAIKGIPSPAPSPYAYQVAFHTPPPTIPARTTATPVPSGNLLSRSPSVADPDDYILSPTKPLEWDLTQFQPPAAPIARPTSAPPQARTPSPKPRWSPIKEKRRIPVTEQVPRPNSTPFKLNITSLFTSAKPLPLTRSTSSSPYSLLRQASSPLSSTSSLAPLIDLSPPPTGVSRIASLLPLIPGLPTPSPEEENHARHLRVPEPVPAVYKLVDAPTPERPTSRLADGHFGPLAIQSTPTRAPKRGSVDEPLVRLTDSADYDDEDDDLDTIQLKPITPMKKFTTKAPSPIALPPLPLSRSTSGGYDSLESPIASPSLAREVEARTERILVELDIDGDEKMHSMAGGTTKYPFPMPLTPPLTAPNMNWAMESPNGEVWGWGGSSADAIHDDEENPFVVRPKGLSQPSSPLTSTDAVEDPFADPAPDAYEDPFADPADVTFVEEASVPEPMAVVSKVEVEPLALLAVSKGILEHKQQEFSPWEECHATEPEEIKEVDVEATKDEWMSEEEKTMVGAEVSQLVADELEEEDVEVEVAVVLIEEESDEPVEVVECIVKTLDVEEDTEEVVEDEDDVKDVEVTSAFTPPTPVETLDFVSANDVEEEFPSPSTPATRLEPCEVAAGPEEFAPISITLEQEEDPVEEFPDPDLLPLPMLVAPTPIVVPHPIICSPEVLLEAKSPFRETPLQTPTPPASPPPTLSRTTSRGRSRLATPEFSPRPKLVVDLPIAERTYSGSITVVPPSALPVEDCSAEATPISPLSPILMPTSDTQMRDSAVEPVSSEDDVEGSLEKLEVPVIPVLEDEDASEPTVQEPETEEPTEGVEDALEDEDDSISSPLPGSFPPASIPAPVDPPPKKTIDSTLIRRAAPSLPFGIQKPRSAIDIALAMQLRPGLGHGSDPAWMVRFLMSVFGWFVVTVSGNIQ